MPPTICVIGLGYIGLPTASALATSGYKVYGVEINQLILEDLKLGRTRIEEPGLRLIVKAAISSGNLVPVGELQPVDVYILCVPTPMNDDRTADLSYVVDVTKQIAKILKHGDLVILESTVPPGTTTRLMQPLLEESGLKAGKDFHLAHCPERVIPGNLLNELIANDRIIGGLTAECTAQAKQLYHSFVDGAILTTDPTTAELVKSMENTYRAVNIALANELAVICKRLGVDVYEAIKLANRHPRVNFLQPGPGVGGHCIPVDPWFIVEKAPKEAVLIRAALERNAGMHVLILQMIEEGLQKVGKGFTGLHVTVLGVAYKADVDDARESPAIPIINHLETNGAKVSIYDPHVMHFKWPIMKDLIGAVRDADVLVLVTDHSEFAKLDLEEIKAHMRVKPLIVDTRNILRDVPEGYAFVRFGMP